MNFLEKILAHKKSEVETRKQQVSEQALRQKIAPASPPRSLAVALSAPELSVIAEIKKASPSAGVIRADFDPVQIAHAYIRTGAHALSVLTDEQFFQGSLRYIEQIRPFASIPLLRKDFILDSYQLLEARAAGADAVLLIVAALTPAQLQALHAQAAELGLSVLVEVHTADELQIALTAGANIIGINNRSLETFKIDLATTEQLAPLIPKGVRIVAESGLHTGADVQRMIRAGVDAVLVGTHFMKQPDPGSALQEFMTAAV
jgi:indole-3-glycerol phosphate synthase